MTTGFQKRIISLPCGKTIIGAVREADNKLKLHKKCCERCKNLIDTSKIGFNNTKNGRNGIHNTRNGNDTMKQLEHDMY